MLIEEAKARLLNLLTDLNNDWDQVVVGLSGGKDSSAVAQLLIDILIESELRDLRVLFLSSDTLIENPLITKQILLKHSQIENIKRKYNLNIEVKMIQPPIQESYLYKTIVEGYSTPLNNGGRWCTRLLKVKPMQEFYKKIESKTLLLTGVRDDESTSRRKNLLSFFEDKELVQEGEFLFSYAPIRNWDVTTLWLYLMDVTRGDDYYMNNDSLWSLYKDGADTLICPTTTEMALTESADQCGKSRYGCYLCPLVSNDKSLEANIKHGYAFQGYLELRKWYMEKAYDKKYRDRMNKKGSVKFKEIFFDSHNNTKFKQLKSTINCNLDDFNVIYVQSISEAIEIVKLNTAYSINNANSIFYKNCETLFNINGHYYIVYTGRLSIEFRWMFLKKIQEIESSYNIRIVNQNEMNAIIKALNINREEG